MNDVRICKQEVISLECRSFLQSLGERPQFSGPAIRNRAGANDRQAITFSSVFHNLPSDRHRIVGAVIVYKKYVHAAGIILLKQGANRVANYLASFRAGITTATDRTGAPCSCDGGPESCKRQNPPRQRLSRSRSQAILLRRPGESYTPFRSRNPPGSKRI
jgi:hypothetical protein